MLVIPAEQNNFQYYDKHFLKQKKKKKDSNVLDKIGVCGSLDKASWVKTSPSIFARAFHFSLN